MTFHSNLKYKFYFTIRNWMNSKPFATYHFEFFFSVTNTKHQNSNKSTNKKMFAAKTIPLTYYGIRANKPNQFEMSPQKMYRY